MGSTSETFDFIIVGAGPAGCLAAHTLANSAKRPSVLLIEAGGKNDNRAARIDAERYITKAIPEQNWSYKTIPQKSMNERILDYDRGKGLGGSSAINFCVYIIAPADDHDEIARLTGDEEWKWENAQQRYRRIESYYGYSQYVPAAMEKYLSADPKNHGSNGPLKIGFSSTWEQSFSNDVEGYQKATSAPTNLDVNNGNVLGVSMTPNTVFQGVRTTAADALHPTPENLHILTDQQVLRVVFDGKTAVGVALADGSMRTASKEIILCAGAIDSPKILLNSGIGPADQLQAFDIAVIDDNPAVGENLHDHPFVFMSLPRKEDSTKFSAYFRDPKIHEEARKQWEQDATGPLAEIAVLAATNFSKDTPLLTSKEFQSLPEEWKTFLQLPGVPSWEHMMLPNVSILQDPMNTLAVGWFGCFLMNPMSRGRVFLQSADPADPAGIDFNMLSHAYDIRNAVGATRALLKAADTEPEARIEGAGYLAPKSDSDEDIIAFWQATGIPTWHATGSVKMGKDVNEPGTCVDKDFKVRNIKGLRVADMSVIPFVTNNHTQPTAFLVGVMLGDRLVKEYGLA